MDPETCEQIKVLFARELAERYGKDGIISLSINPGSISTGLFKNLPYIVQCYVVRLWPRYFSL